tara:strand:+ start:3245 stop:4726 length:1482 start_codon:yes stop_codon:yes gene_type:complete
MSESWSKESNTKAAGSGTTQDTGWVLDSLQAFLVQNSSLAEIFKIDSAVGGNISFGETTDGGDRTISFGHGTLHSCIGVDDSQDVFAINTDASLEDVNDIEINSSGHVRLGQGILLGPDDGSLTIKADTDMIFQIDSDSDGTETFQFKNGAGTEIVEISELGNLQIDGDITVSGNTILSSTATVFTLSGNDADLMGDLTITGNNITFPNNQLITSGGEHIQFKAIGTDDRMLFYLSSINPGSSGASSDDGEDVGVILEANNGVAGAGADSVIWSNQIDLSTRKTGTDSLKWDYNVTVAGNATMLELTKNGTLLATADLVVKGQDIGSAIDSGGDVYGAINFPGSVNFVSPLTGTGATFTSTVQIKQANGNVTNGLYLINDFEDGDPSSIQGIAQHGTDSDDESVFATIHSNNTSVIILIIEEATRNFNISHCFRDSSGNVQVTTVSNHDIVSAGSTGGDGKIKYTDTTNDMTSTTYKIIQLGGDGYISALTSS